MASKSKRNKVKFKWTKELGFLIAALLIVIGVTVGLAIPTRAERNIKEINDAIEAWNAAEETSYYTVPLDDLRIEVLTHDQLVQRKNKEEVVLVWYGTLSEDTYLENIYGVNQMAIMYKIDKVYLVYNTYIAEATENETTASVEYKQTVDKMEAELNENANAKDINLEITSAFFVWKNGSLVFNSQVAADTAEYSTGTLMYKAFGYFK